MDKPTLTMGSSGDRSAGSSVSSDSASLGSFSALSSPVSPGTWSDGGVSDTDPRMQRQHGHVGARFMLVIGGLGFIGSHTTLELLKAGHNVIVVDDLSNSYATVLTRVRQLAAAYFEKTKKKDGDTSGGAAAAIGGAARLATMMPLLHFHKLNYRSESMRYLLESYSEQGPDPTRPGKLARRSAISGVIHFAAFKSVSESISRPLGYYGNNVCGLVGLLELLGRHGIRNLVFSSSATVYGSKADGGRPLREEDLVHQPQPDAADAAAADTAPTGLQSPYARSKYFCEAILADVAAADPNWRIIALRYFNPIGCDPSGMLGEDPRATPTNLFPVIAQVLAGERTELDVFGSDWDTRDGTAVRDFVHVVDVARGHVAAVEAPRRPSGPAFRAFNLGSGTGTSVVEAIDALESAAGRKIPVRRVPRRAGDVGSCVASRERAHKELGWEPREPIPQCAADLWNFMTKAKGVC